MEHNYIHIGNSLNESILSDLNRLPNLQGVPGTIDSGSIRIPVEKFPVQNLHH
jgi:hypothetical protein